MTESTAPADRPLARRLHEEAVRRGLRAPGAPLPDAHDLFVLVRDFPYARASGHDPETIIDGWRGTCSTKHELLRDLLAELGVASTVMACTQEIRLPPGAADLVAAFGAEPVVDVHNYLVVHGPAGDVVVDATWPDSARAAGVTVNDALDWERDQQIACTPIETWALSPGEDVSAFKDRLLRGRYTPAQLVRREAFIEAVGRLFLRGG